ncbi:cation:proton antiporter domain-containing protein [Ramlibacter sp. MAHUQ-53]|uniref:cation:proton antiporter domain-containing protein n=1 Tax=unclassified Ramlibacter TaxID=2617605 RepID=UPI003633B455
MEHSTPLPFLSETLLFLVLAGLLIPLLQRFRINQVLGFLTAGLLLGPHALGALVPQAPWLKHLTFTEVGGVQALGELGVVFLMFLIGLELSPERLWAMRRWVLLGGGVQVGATAVVLGLLAWAFGNTVPAAIVLGLVLSLSSTAVVMQLLSERRALATPVGQAGFAILMLQDFAVVPVLILVDLLGQPTSSGFALVLGTAALKSGIAILLIFLLGRRVLVPVFRYFADRRQPEVFMALTLLVALGTAGATGAAGLSPALGAFLAGLLLAETEYRHEVEVTIEPFKGLLMGLFFMSVGMGIDLAEVGRHPGWILASVLGLMAIKAVVAAGVLRAGGLSSGRAVEGGLLLSQGGEFAFVVIGAALGTGLLERPVGQFMLLVVGFSLMLTPAASRLGRWWGRRLDARAPAPQDAGAGEADLPETLAGHVVIAGFGRVGQLLADVLESQGVAYVAVEQDARAAARLHREGRPVYYGNASRPEMLVKLHTRDAAALLVTMDQPAAAMHALRCARAACPDLPIYVRSRDERHARELREAGATGVVPETLEAGLQLSAMALQAARVPSARVAEALVREREART